MFIKENPNDMITFRAEDVNDPRWEKIISVLKANIPGFEVLYGDGNWMNFYIPGSYDEVDWDKVYGDDYWEEDVIEATNVGFFNPDLADVFGNEINDETQFDTHDEDELAELWWEFCKENNLITVTKGMADYMTGEWV